MSAIHTQAPVGEEYNPAEEVRLSRGVCWMFIIAFFGLMLGPPVWREATGDGLGEGIRQVVAGGDRPLVERLRAFEGTVDEAAWLLPLRQRVQWLLTRVLRAGNSRAVVGKEGWLLYRPGLRALTGYGPLRPQPRSVAQDPAHGDWQAPLPVIADFARQLQERGIRLVLAPVPDKAVVVGEALGPGTTGVRHPAAADFYRQLEERGVTVVPLLQPLQEAQADGSAFLRQDTHWSPAGMRACALTLAGHLGRDGVGEAGSAAVLPVADQGDLVEQLDLPPLQKLFPPEEVELLQVPGAPGADASSPLVLIGDSFVNIFEDPNLPYHGEGAGLAAHLSAALGRALHVIAINGGGATACREQLARLPADVIRAKETVVWVLAERDLFLAASDARALGVEWKTVEFSTRASAEPAPAGAVVVEATLMEKSRLQDMRQMNYPDALYVALFRIDRVVSGSLSEEEATVVMWNFRRRQPQPTAALEPGSRHRLTLRDFAEAHPELAEVNLSDDFNRFDLPLLFAEKVEPLP